MRILSYIPVLLLAACGQESGPRSEPPAATSAGLAPESPSGGADSITAVDATRIRSLADAASPDELGLRGADELDDASLMATAAIVRYRAREVPGYPGLYEFLVNNTGTGWQEKFLLQVPPTPPTGPVPLVVVFHKFGSSHGDLLSTTFPAETQARGWYCMAPLGARQKNFGNLESQINTQIAIELVADLFPVDRNRVYGVGFSMGGGGLTNYAARHLDPDGIRFAAICEHTGSVALAHTWYWEPDDSDADDNQPTAGSNLEVPDVLEDLFGGPPSAQPFAYQRFSSIELDPVAGTIQSGTDFARNLAHIPLLTWIANADPIAYLQTQTFAFEGHTNLLNPANQLYIASGAIHSWTTLDEAYVCDWFQLFTLQTPTSGNLLADEDGVWFHFQVEQDSPGSFTSMSWNVSAGTRTVEIGASSNLRRLTVDSPALGLTLSGAVTLRLSAADGSGDLVRLLGATAAPVSVLRDGQAASGTYSSLTESFEIVEADPAQHEWVIVFP